MIKHKKLKQSNQDISKIFLRLASPDKILEWSHGEVIRPETVNYRTQRSEKNGLFDERTFGPEKDYECYCGKYKGIRYKGIVCEKCGVEITRSIVRRERMGHIELASPVAHIWFLRSIPSRIATLLGMGAEDIEKVVYFAGYLVTRIDEEERKRILTDLDSEFKSKLKSVQDEKTKEALKDLFSKTRLEVENLQMGRVLDEVEYHKFSLKYGGLFDAEIGAEAVYKIFKNLDLKKLLEQLNIDKEKNAAAGREKINKRISMVKSMINSGIRPEWMFLIRIPVIPPALRPMVALDGGRHATSDVNDLYRRVINRNNRLKKLLEIGAPDVILRNEKRILQEAVDALIDNTIRHNNANSLAQGGKRALKSLADNLKGKRGLFRGNLLGKRVDYSGRSVIVIGPDLKLNQCGLPKYMALELFRPFVISGLLKRELAFNNRGAGRLIDDGVPEVWEILEEVIKDKYVLLNRAPTLHRLGIQAFKPKLIEGLAIQVHPLVCAAFNADFDGDQMAVHVPLSPVAQYEAREIMAADKNVLKPGSGDPIVTAKQDVLLGCYWVTKMIDGDKGEDMIFPGPNSAVTAYDFGIVGLRSKIKIKGKPGSKYAPFEEQLLETTVGRILFNEILPEDYPFVNQDIEKNRMSQIMDDMINKYGIDKMPEILDRIKTFGFKYATVSGITWSIDDIVIPEDKGKVVDAAVNKVEVITKQYEDGLLSEDEKHRKIVDIWYKAKEELEKLIPATLSPNGPVHDIWKSGARGSIGQLTNMAGMKGLIVNSKGEVIEHPVLSCSKEGFNPIEYFTTTHGSRKGLADTALNTAKSGYLTRRLFDVSQDVVISEHDCGTQRHILIRADSDSGIQIPLAKKIRGRILAKDIVDKDEKVLFKKGHLITKGDAKQIQTLGIEEIAVRSPMTCGAHTGICANCYGVDLGTDSLIDLGEAVGTIAAQAIGEPGTQLTMRTFHAGGTASAGGDITRGLPRVEEVFERRKPKVPAIISKTAGVVSAVLEEGKERKIKVLSDATEAKIKDSKEVEYSFPSMRVPLVKAGDRVEKGQLLTDGSADIAELLKYGGREKAQEYIIAQVNKIYELQGETVSRKHIEVIVRQMFSRVKIVNSGDTQFASGDTVSVVDLERANEEIQKEGKEKATASSLVLGISEVSLSRRSFLSAASFQHTTKVLINSAIRGSEDFLLGLKENVILGRIIPAGTGFVGSKKHANAQEIHKKMMTEYESSLGEE